MELVQFKVALDEVGRIPCVGIASGRLDRRDLAGLTVFLGELLDATQTDVVPVCDVLRVELVIDNQSTDPGDIVAIELHLVSTLKGAIMPTKSFPDSTFYRIHGNSQRSKLVSASTGGRISLRLNL